MDKTQPQKLLEEIIPRDENEQYPTDPPEIMDAPKFPTIEAQMDYWRKKEAAERPPEIDAAYDRLEAAKREYEMNEATRPEVEPKPPRKWSAARRRKFNATVAKKVAGGFTPVPPPPQESSPSIRYCPHCGTSIEKWLS